MIDVTPRAHMALQTEESRNASINARLNAMRGGGNGHQLEGEETLFRELNLQMLLYVILQTQLREMIMLTQFLDSIWMKMELIPIIGLPVML